MQNGIIYTKTKKTGDAIPHCEIERIGGPMAIIQTQQNHVRIYRPEPDHDLFVETLTVPNDGSNTYQCINVMPITNWQDAVDWALGIADQMAHPIIVAAIGGESFLRRHDKRICDTLANLTDQERGEMRQIAITACASIMRDCDDQHVRADAYDALVQLKVVLP